MAVFRCGKPQWRERVLALALEVEDGTNVVTSFCDSARELVMILKSGKAMAIANLSKITEAEAAAYVFAACNFERT